MNYPICWLNLHSIAITTVAPPQLHQVGATETSGVDPLHLPHGVDLLGSIGETMISTQDWEW